MKGTILLVGLTLSLAINATGQQPNPQATPPIQESLTPAGQQVGDSAGTCIASIKRISFKRQPLLSAIKPHVPKTAFELSRWRDGRCRVGCAQALLAV